MKAGGKGKEGVSAAAGCLEHRRFPRGRVDVNPGSGNQGACLVNYVDSDLPGFCLGRHKSRGKQEKDLDGNACSFHTFILALNPLDFKLKAKD